MELAGRNALLTGATGGLGRAIAEAMAARGAVLLLSARKREALEEMAAGLPGDGHRVLPADLAEPDAAERLSEEEGVASLGDVARTSRDLLTAAAAQGFPVCDFTRREL